MPDLCRRDLFKSAGALAAAPWLRAQPPRKPNVLFIVLDDLGYGEFGCYGQKQIRTPNIDRVAGQGIRYTDFYAGGAVCAPSRSVLMTGLHTGHTSVRAYRLEATVLDKYRMRVIVSRVGEILRVELPDGWELVNDQLITL